MKLKNNIELFFSSDSPPQNLLYGSAKTFFGDITVGMHGGIITHIALSPLSAFPSQQYRYEVDFFAQMILLTFLTDSSPTPLTLLAHGTPFQIKVWKVLLSITEGSCVSYSELAKRIGKPNASRSVGKALKSNPLCLLIPCHRVVYSNKKLGGFSGGAETKRQLLQFEQYQTTKDDIITSPQLLFI